MARFIASTRGLSGEPVPRVSEFYGVVISLYFGDNVRHSAPHFHARYAEHSAVLSIPDGDVLNGSLPPKRLKVVQAWAILRAAELEHA